MTSQADIFRVLRDLAEQEGGWSQEVRELLARDILGWQLASCWTSGDDSEVETYHRHLVGEDGGIFLATVMLDDRAGMVYQWYWSAGERRQVPAESMRKAQAAADAEVRAQGLVLLTPPLEQLAARLLELKEWPGFVEHLLGESRPEDHYPEVWRSHGHDQRIQQLLNMLGYEPPVELPVPDLSWLIAGLVLEVYPPIYTYEGVATDEIIQGARAWLGTQDPRATWELGDRPPREVQGQVLYHVALRTRVRLEDYGELGWPGGSP